MENNTMKHGKFTTISYYKTNISWYKIICQLN